MLDAVVLSDAKSVPMPAHVALPTQGWERCNKMYEKLKKEMFHLVGSGIEVEGLPQDACKMVSACFVADRPTNSSQFQCISIYHPFGHIWSSDNTVSRLNYVNLNFTIPHHCLRPSLRQAWVCPHLKVSCLRWPNSLPAAGKISVRCPSRL